ncbi:beta,beta-carotene 15,15'-dioxygenase-like [Dendronephthya gigantea]|uniref:beta,beta-carotene 15,15'-dioxygenase-like n=1 Tax=Dendronephthya gigantea TaxID=151771 RepID=UPI00106B15A4|nr:beta,beta-carotene 15,15'-dioxygenase-like [Dendronephthya gigantea]
MACQKNNNNAPLFYQSVEELSEAIETKITGNFPRWIKGTLLRNGPGKFEIGSSSYRHLFDGLAMLQQFVIDNGNVTYFNKFLRSQTYKKNMKAGMIVDSEFGTLGVPDPCKNIFARWFTYFLRGEESSDNALINFCCIKGKIYAISEFPVVTEIDSSNLECLDRVNLSDAFEGTIKRYINATAHPQEDADGSVYNLGLGYDKEKGLVYVITVLPANTEDTKSEQSPSEGRIVTRIPASLKYSYSHSFGMTQKYFIVIQQPLTVNVLKIAVSRFVGWNILDTFSWNTDVRVKFFVISRESGEVVLTIESEPFFFFHVVNAYDDGNEIALDICCYTDANLFDQLYLHEIRKKTVSSGKGSPLAQLRRYRLPTDLEASEATLQKQPSGLDYEILSDICLDLPRINEKYARVRHRYVYGACGSDDSVDDVSIYKLVKVDVETKESLIWSEDQCMVSEPVFIPAPDSQEEDDGVVMSSVYDPVKDNSFLLVLDARSFTELARAVVPLRFAPSIHGRFFS